MSHATRCEVVLYSCAGDPQQHTLSELQARLPEVEFRCWPDNGNPDDIRFAVVWQAPPGLFASLPALECVLCISAGVDALLARPDLRASVAVVRLEDAGMAAQMAEYVLFGVLCAQRRFLDYQLAQRQEQWLRHDYPARPAGQHFVGILGAGALGRQVATCLIRAGYPTGCWSRRAQALPEGVQGFSGPEGLRAMLPCCQVLVCLLPLTAQTTGLLNAAVFAQLPAGAFLINTGRGAHLVAGDLLQALDDGHLDGALLDVFDPEPLPADHAFWRHPRVIMTPHMSAPCDPDRSAEQIASNLQRLIRGDAPQGLVDRTRGY